MTAATWTEHENYIQFSGKSLTECSVIGYARVSTDDQDLAFQISALKDAGCELIYTEKQSTRKKRPVFEIMKEAFTRFGDALTVWRLDRLGRDLVEMVLTVEYFQRLGVTLKSLTENLQMDSASGILAFHILAAFAQYERNVISERTKAGIAIAKKNGKVFGNPSKIFGEHKIEILIDIWNPKLTNKQIMFRNGYKSTATLQNHFQGEKGRMLQAKKRGPTEFERIRMARLKEVTKQESIPIRRLNEIIKTRETYH